MSNARHGSPEAYHSPLAVIDQYSSLQRDLSAGKQVTGSSTKQEPHDTNIESLGSYDENHELSNPLKRSKFFNGKRHRSSVSRFSISSSQSELNPSTLDGNSDRGSTSSTQNASVGKISTSAVPSRNGSASKSLHSQPNRSEKSLCLQSSSESFARGDLTNLSSEYKQEETEQTSDLFDVSINDGQKTHTPNSSCGFSMPGMAEGCYTPYRTPKWPQCLRPTMPWSSSGDRFISPRRVKGDSRINLKVSRPVEILTGHQKMLRRRTGLTDPFGSLRRGVSTSLESPRASQNPRNISPSLFQTDNVLAVRPESRINSNRYNIGASLWNSVSLPPFRRYQRHDTVSESQTSPPIYTSKFLQEAKSSDDLDAYEKRLALALDIDQSATVLRESREPRKDAKILSSSSHSRAIVRRTTWKNNEWVREGLTTVLEAPGLRDDFYCSVLTYSHKVNRLVVALGYRIYLWTEAMGVIYPPPELDVHPLRAAHVTSVAFSSEPGGKAILAVGRGDGRIVLWSPQDSESRFLRFFIPHAAAHLSFRPAPFRRPSQRHPAIIAENEVFLVGDDTGVLSIYFVEWPTENERFLFGWQYGIILHARITVHAQQICGISWSPDGELFVTGGNDNLCCLFQANKFLNAEPEQMTSNVELRRDANGQTYLDITPVTELAFGPESARHHWRLNAAVKAIAFCPWEKGLVAAGGGSNDRCIHFFHTMSGSCLAKIDCAAQITSLIWSNTRREIAATFGFAQPEHPFRIAVYAWPSCQQVVAIPWHGEMRALSATAYPGGPTQGRVPGESSSRGSPAVGEGCIVVAGSDGTIKFHEIWTQACRATAPSQGLLGGSDILESLHGIDKDEREVIR